MRLTEEQLAAHQKRVKPPRTPLTAEIEGLQKAYASAKPKKAPTIAQKRRGSVGERIPTEHEEQAAVIQWWAGYAAQHKIPENLLFAIPNGANKSMASAAKFKREGLRKGVPDLFLAVPRGFHGLFLEMKRTVKAQVSDEQYYFAEGLMDQGYRVVFCFCAENAIRVIKEYLE